MDAAARGGRTELTPVEAKSTFMTLTTLSFAIKPLMSEVQIRQSPRPMGRSSGAIHPASRARILC